MLTKLFSYDLERDNSIHFTISDETCMFGCIEDGVRWLRITNTVTRLDVSGNVTFFQIQDSILTITFNEGEYATEFRIPIESERP